MCVLEVNCGWLVVDARIFKYKSDVFLELFYVRVNGLILLFLSGGVYFFLNGFKIDRDLNNIEIVANLFSVNWFPEGPAVFLAKKELNNFTELVMNWFVVSLRSFFIHFVSPTSFFDSIDLHEVKLTFLIRKI